MSDTITSPEETVRAAADAAADVVTVAEECAVRCVRKIQQRPIQSLLIAMAAGVFAGLVMRR
ncbi:hypothetical protein GXW78_25635 [Roseomonas terrae]|uniref:DUF883 domain-containing protein n=1 Tax=Neoroseomonas terrae TaxID=424799 RepID=A0ABS5EPW4_9PROT|nr:hypothetical protein [Neoroseomonas terrae]MBR0653064.1 hypothetical protein [Neoroseomonas terrae]